MVRIEDFDKLDIRVGQIRSAEYFPEAKKPAYKLTIDFGPEIGIKKSSAQITRNYTLEELPSKWIMAIVNLLPRQIGPFISEVLVLGLQDEAGDVILVVPDKQGSKMGARLF